MPRPRSYGLVLFPQFEVLDVAGPLEALNCLTRINAEGYEGVTQDEIEEIKLSVIACDKNPVNPGPITPEKTSVNFAGQQFYLPTYTFDTAPDLDVVIIPGGLGAIQKDATSESGFKNPAGVIEFLQRQYNTWEEQGAEDKYIFSICTGARLLATAKILDGHHATTNKATWKLVTPAGRKTYWKAKARWVVSGNIWTTSGVSAGTDGMLGFLESLYGRKVVDWIETVMEYNATHEHDDIWAKKHDAHDVKPQE
ncbi:class I glutamine amidotransferase-like protein [Myriangium duriaei CBS 260.36]|uniref:Class I glutamine amidotransferase-like protein n=1 Tax=Myriangium duriaei CBS 260.36 TaxID=1168546 RepID=A0A9P4J306_9PEZI|nr:class I glutamine amidotransferase-like protein [Myriangium duriaei CBS 260.36]